MFPHTPRSKLVHLLGIGSVETAIDVLLGTKERKKLNCDDDDLPVITFSLYALFITVLFTRILQTQ